MTDLTQRLPSELLAEILGLASPPDILRFKQINRVFRDVILASPLIQHKIELYTAGLEYNAAAGTSLADSKGAFAQYRSNLGSLCPVEKRTVEILKTRLADHAKSGGGVFVIVEDSVRVFTLDSPSRGIPHSEWEIPLPVIDPADYCFYPGDDVIAFIKQQGAVGNPQIRIYLRSLSDGGSHPDALCPTIHYSRRGADTYGISSVSITSSRLVVFTTEQPRMTTLLIIWDWKGGQLLFELDEDRYNAVEFIDNYWLLVLLDRAWNTAPQSLVLVDTEKVVEGAPMQTTF